MLALGAWASGVRELRRAVVPVGSHIVATEPIPERIAELGWTGGELLGDTRLLVHYAQVTRDGRIVFGRGGGAIGPGGRVLRRHFVDPATVGVVADGFRRWFPSLGDVSLTHAWGGAVDRAPGHLPFAGSLGPRVHYVTGFSGNGVGPSALLGRIVGPDGAGRARTSTRRAGSSAGRRPTCRRSRSGLLVVLSSATRCGAPRARRSGARGRARSAARCARWCGSRCRGRWSRGCAGAALALAAAAEQAADRVDEAALAADGACGASGGGASVGVVLAQRGLDALQLALVLDAACRRPAPAARARRRRRGRSAGSSATRCRRPRRRGGRAPGGRRTRRAGRGRGRGGRRARRRGGAVWTRSAVQARTSPAFKVMVSGVVAERARRARRGGGRARRRRRARG